MFVLLYVMSIVIVPLFLPTLFGKRGIFTLSHLLWVFKTLSFLCYHIQLPRLSYLHISLPFPLYRGNTHFLPNAVNYLANFLTALQRF